MAQTNKQGNIRKFGLNLEDCKTRRDYAFYKAALKAYLKGKKRFKFGKTEHNHRRVDAWYKTPIK